jgi:hypothetical protein
MWGIMSISALTTLAVERERAAPGSGKVMGGKKGIGAAGVPQDFKDALVAAIPTEPLSAYTAALGILVGIPIAGANAEGKYLPFRWAAFAVFILATVSTVIVSYTLKRRSPGPVGVEAAAQTSKPRPVPWAEMFAAAIAAAAWGLAMPGSALNTQLSGNPARITAGSIAIGGAALLSVVSLFLTKPSNSNTVTTPPNPQSPVVSGQPVPAASPATPDPVPPGG